MEETNWNLISNKELKEECERLEKEFVEKQEIMKDLVSKIEELDTNLTELSKNYVEIKKILNKREGKNDDI